MDLYQIRDRISRNTRLIDACVEGDTDQVIQLIESGADITHSGNEAIKAAAHYGHADIVRLLLDKGADPAADPRYAIIVHNYYDNLSHIERTTLEKIHEFHTSNQDAAISYSIFGGHQEIVELLLPLSELTNENLIKPLHHNPALHLWETLLKCFKPTPQELLSVLRSENPELRLKILNILVNYYPNFKTEFSIILVVAYLLHIGDNDGIIEVLDSRPISEEDGWILLTVACLHADVRMLEYIHQRIDGEFTSRDFTFILERRSIQHVEYLASQDSDLKLSERGLYSLCNSTLEFNLRVMSHVDVTQNKNRWICIACCFDRLDVVRALIDHGADLHARDDVCLTLTADMKLLEFMVECGLIYKLPKRSTIKSVRRGNRDIVKFLMRQGVLCEDMLYSVALDCRPEHLEVIRELVQYVEDCSEFLPIVCDAQEELLEIVELLIKHSSNVNYRPLITTDEVSLSALDKAVYADYIGSVKMLLDAGAEINHNARVAACYKGNIEMIKLLLERGGFDDYMIVSAFEYNQIDVIITLLKFGADIHAQDDAVIDIVCKEGYQELLEYLIARDDFRHKYETAIEIAREYKHSDLEEILRNLKN